MSSNFDPSRRQLFRGDIGVRNLPVRPPWSIAESAFTQACTRCNKCVDTCPEGILFAGSGGFPEVDFQRGECSFCTDCVAACESAAFSSPNETPWKHKVEIGEGCITHKQVVCRSCGENCEPEAITFTLQAGRVATPQVDLDLCNGCGACIAVCPTKVVSVLAAEAG